MRRPHDRRDGFRPVMRRALMVVGMASAAVALAIGLGVLVPRPLSLHGSEPVIAGTVADPDVARSGHRILVLSSAIHTDIAVPVDATVRARFGFMAGDGLDPAMPGVQYLVIGWGGRSFYIETPTWADLKPGPVARALTVDQSVMHVSLAGAIDPAHPSVVPIELDGGAFARLLDAVDTGFAVGADSRPILVPGAHYSDFDRFYEARGWFNALVGCNLWTARMLRAAGLKTGIWTPLPRLLTASLRVHNADLIRSGSNGSGDN